ncbi:DUF2065 domain-containing protein [Thiorhodospira sibirica]|uniref:DUF2065 domain-containing protein n=1 Tax=Thiorhodospira sibirica TaxID=154347 RepID=UPI00022C1701|nr:DUF2065 domain-containing protein [Thiorhodospira sibirica]
MLWTDFLAAIALLLIIEGILPFLDPAGTRRRLLQMAQIPTGVFRGVGLFCMLAGLLLLWWVRG